MSDTTTVRPPARILLACDDSPPAQAALDLAIGAAQALHAAIDIVAVVDDSRPERLLEALDDEARAILAAASARCRECGIETTTGVVHDVPVAGILAAADEHASDLIVMGTHGRAFLARTVLGSTCTGVLRMSTVPVLTVRGGEAALANPFAGVVIAIDESEPAEAAAAFAAMLAQSGSRVTAINAIDTRSLYSNAAAYGFDPTEMAATLQREARDVVRAALARTTLADTTPIDVVDGEAAAAIASSASAHHATCVIIGTHGRRGIRRLAFGSVAEHVVRISTVPVLVVRTAGTRSGTADATPARERKRVPA